MGDIYSDLLIRIRPQDTTSEAYSVEAQLNDGAAGVFRGELRLDHDRLTATRSDPVEYGLALFDTLFTGAVRRAYDEAFTGSPGEAGQGMRVRLWIDDAASELHALAWEGIYHMRTGQPAPLFLSCLTPFSRYADLLLAAPPPVPSSKWGAPFACCSPYQVLLISTVSATLALTPILKRRSYGRPSAVWNKAGSSPFV